MAKTVKMCDMRLPIAVKVFEMLNPTTVTVKPAGLGAWSFVIITDTEPENLIYPEGWYYAKGCFRNKHQSTTGMYEEAHMLTSKNELWKDLAKYCTLR